MKGRLLVSVVFIVLGVVSCGGTKSEQPSSAGAPEEVAPLIMGKTPAVSNRNLSAVSEADRSGVRFDEAEGDGLAYLPDVEFSNGTIEFDVRGRNVAQRSFVGIAFHGADSETFDASLLSSVQFPR